LKDDDLCRQELRAKEIGTRGREGYVGSGILGNHGRQRDREKAEVEERQRGEMSISIAVLIKSVLCGHRCVITGPWAQSLLPSPPPPTQKKFVVSMKFIVLMRWLEVYSKLIQLTF